MCRFTVRGPPPGAAAAEPQELKGEPLDLANLFSEDLDAADLALLSLFGPTAGTPAAPAGQPSPVSSSAGAAADANSTVVMGQALCVPAGPQGAGLAAAIPAAPPAVAALPVAAPASAVQQLQFQAVMQHQAAIMQNPAAYPQAAQMYQTAMLQQQQMLSQQAAVPPLPLPAAHASSGALCGKRAAKTHEEVEEQTERVKKRRRESAQRSRQRKNAYMRGLEMENRALKMENERLRVELTKTAGSGAVAMLPKASSGSVSRQSAGVACSGQHDGSEHVSLTDDEGDVLCDELLGAPADIAPDALALMPTADLLNFAF